MPSHNSSISDGVHGVLSVPLSPEAATGPTTHVKTTNDVTTTTPFVTRIVF